VRRLACDYAIDLDLGSQACCETVFAWPLMQEWTDGAKAEPDEIIELEVEF
jgi:glutathione S-transferase